MLHLRGYSIFKIINLAKYKYNSYSSYLSVCIEHHPVRTSHANKLELMVRKELNTIECEESIQSNFELQKSKEIFHLETTQENCNNLKQDLNISIKYSIQDIEEFNQKEFQSLKVSSKLLDKDSDEKINSLIKNSDKSLFFMSKKEFVAGTKIWLPPTGIIYDGESFKEAATRIINEYGENINIFLYGNVPVGYTKYAFTLSNKQQNKHQKHKIYFILAKYLNGLLYYDDSNRWLEFHEIQKLLPNPIFKNISYLFITSK